MKKIDVWYVDTSNPNYRDWQLNHDNPYFICIDCFKLSKRKSEFSQRCLECTIKHRKLMKQVHKERYAKKLLQSKVPNGMTPKTYKKKHPACEMCGYKGQLTVDHIIPIAQGGKSVESNYQTLCKKCHLMKNTCEDIWKEANDTSSYLQWELHRVRNWLESDK